MIYLFNAFFPTGNIGFDIATSHSTRIPPACIILDNWVFENFILANEPFAKALQILESYESVNNNSCGKLASSISNFQSNLMKDLKLLQFHILLQILTY